LSLLTSNSRIVSVSLFQPTPHVGSPETDNTSRLERIELRQMGLHLRKYALTSSVGINADCVDIVLRKEIPQEP
jgi:hypothetical protein